MKFSPNHDDVYISGILFVYTSNQVHFYSICTDAPACWLVFMIILVLLIAIATSQNINQTETTQL